MERKLSLFLFGIFFLALLLRLYNLSSLPFSFHTDELFAGYIGRYIFLHGHDIYGNLFPLYVNKFGDFRPIGIFWFSGLSTFVFGVNEFATRFPSAFFGALTIFPFFLTANALFKNKWIGILSALILAILPWHISLSRATSESVIGLFFYSFALYFAVVFVKTNSPSSIIKAVAFGLVSYLFYHSYRIVVPLTFLPLLIFSSKKIKVYILIALIIFFGITIALGLSNQGAGRLNQVVFYKDFALQNTITNLTAGEGSNNVLRARIFHNKAVVYARGFLKQYVSYFSPQFLLEDGGLPARYVTPDVGLLYYILVPFFLLSFIFVFPYLQKNKLTGMVFYLLFISVLPAAITYEDSPNISRASIMILPLVLLISLGFYESLKKIGNNKLKISYMFFVFLVTTLELVYFWHQYSVHQKTYKSILRNEGNQQLSKYVISNKNTYTNIYMPSSDDLTIYYLFYTKNFSKFKPNELSQVENNGSIGNVHFVNDLCLDSLLQTHQLTVSKNSLVIIGGDCKNVGITSQIIYTRSDGTNAYKSFVVH